MEKLSSSIRRAFKVFPRRLASGEIFSNRLLFNNWLLFSENFCRGQGFDGEEQSHYREDYPAPLTRENPGIGKTIAQ